MFSPASGLNSSDPNILRFHVVCPCVKAFKVGGYVFISIAAPAIGKKKNKLKGTVTVRNQIHSDSSLCETLNAKP